MSTTPNTPHKDSPARARKRARSESPQDLPYVAVYKGHKQGPTFVKLTKKLKEDLGLSTSEHDLICAGPGFEPPSNVSSDPDASMIVDSVTELSSDAPMPAQAIPSTEHDTIISTFTTSSADIEIIPNPVQRTTIDLTTSSSLPPSSPPSGYQIASSITQSSSPVAIRRAASVLSDAVHAPGDNEDVVENHSVMAEIEILEHERDATLVMIDSVIISGERHEEKVKKLRLVRGLVRVALGCEDVAL